MQNYNSKYKKTSQQTIPEILLIGLLKGIVALFRLIFKGFGGKKGLATAEKQSIILKRREIEEMVKSDNIHELKQAVFEADKLVDRVLSGYGYSGDTMGERLKSARDYIDRHVYDGIWQGHKVRNQLAHEHNMVASPQQLKAAAGQLLRYVKTL